MVTPEDVRAQYGFVALLAQQIPEVGALMQQAVNEQWTADRFSLALANTGWWKTTPAPVRQWVSTQYADPATARQELATGGQQVGDLAKRFGYEGIAADVSERIWLEGRLAGYGEQQMSTWAFNALSVYNRAGGQVPAGGEYGQRVQDAIELAAAYGYSPGDLRAQAVRVATDSIGAGQDRATGLAGWADKLRRFAAAKYAPHADRIKAGDTVADIAEPYRAAYAELLEVAQPGLDDPLIQRWLQGVPQAGKPPAAVPVWQAQQEMRQDPRWGYTTNARRSAAQVLTEVGKSFGMIG